MFGSRKITFVLDAASAVARRVNAVSATPELAIFLRRAARTRLGTLESRALADAAEDERLNLCVRHESDPTESAAPACSAHVPSSITWT